MGRLRKQSRNLRASIPRSAPGQLPGWAWQGRGVPLLHTSWVLPSGADIPRIRHTSRIILRVCCLAAAAGRLPCSSYSSYAGLRERRHAAGAGHRYRRAARGGLHRGAQQGARGIREATILDMTWLTRRRAYKVWRAAWSKWKLKSAHNASNWKTCTDNWALRLTPFYCPTRTSTQASRCQHLRCRTANRKRSRSL